MKKFFTFILAVIAVITSSCNGEVKTVTVGKPSKLDTISYAIGALSAYNIKQAQIDNIPFDYSVISNGMCDVASQTSHMTHQGALDVLRDFFTNTYSQRSKSVANGEGSFFDNKEQVENLSYALGVDMWSSYQTQGEFPVQTYWITIGLNDAHLDKSLFSEGEVNDILNKYFAARYEQKWLDISKSEGVVTTSSSLMYRIENKGEETYVTNDSDVVKILYTAKFVSNDAVFDTNRFADSSEKRKKYLLGKNPDAALSDTALEVALNTTITGLIEGLKLVGKGGRISLWIPSELAYGSEGIENLVAPNRDVFYDVELIDITPKPEPDTSTFDALVKSLAESTKDLTKEQMEEIIYGK